MKAIVIAVLIGVAQIPARAAGNSVPSAAGGFTLGSNIDQYGVSRYDNYLKEVIITDMQGFRKGFITFGTCRRPGAILRIKLKYENDTYPFYEQLLERYREAFGRRPRFDGDQFGNVKAWKWEFSNDQGNRVTLVLQHNLEDDDESMGNMVKLSLPDLMNEERACFNEAHRSPANEAAGSAEPDWSVLIPQ